MEQGRVNAIWAWTLFKRDPSAAGIKCNKVLSTMAPANIFICCQHDGDTGTKNGASMGDELCIKGHCVVETHCAMSLFNMDLRAVSADPFRHVK